MMRVAMRVQTGKIRKIKFPSIRISFVQWRPTDLSWKEFCDGDGKSGFGGVFEEV